ncbi:MAG: hypothetical protein CM1200mP12_23210 [Gammaproteobacteria bacterium]|nr:MAG: hypothetical protein CM1200mP12_23210 [Gammaproteobacteria bacterium]
MCGTAEAIALGVKNGLDASVLSEIIEKVLVGTGL